MRRSPPARGPAGRRCPPARRGRRPPRPRWPGPGRGGGGLLGRLHPGLRPHGATPQRRPGPGAGGAVGGAAEHPVRRRPRRERPAGPHVLWVAAVVAVASSVLPYSVNLEALRRIPPRVFGVLTSLEPAAGALFGLLIRGQRLAWPQWLGIAAVACASVIATFLGAGGRRNSRGAGDDAHEDDRPGFLVDVGGIGERGLVSRPGVPPVGTHRWRSSSHRRPG
ncbi:EamA family transporter [Streptomyces sp. BRA346]|uniref:EamA family transporter n=1 Tax=Streptomyces sp. BRA346 TaxID=2878199 RepID=UPI004062933A